MASATASPALVGRNAPDDEAVADVVADGHVREERVVLEHGVDVAIERRDAGDVAAVQPDRPRGGLLEPGDHAQGGRLSRARWTEHAEELAVGDLQVDAIDRDDVAEGLDHALERARPAALRPARRLGVHP